MRRNILKVFAFLLSAIAVFLVGCDGQNGHECSFIQTVQSEGYLKEDTTCEHGKLYYYSCTCGAHGEETFEVGNSGIHVFSQKIVSEKYLKYEATCQEGAVYYKACESCGKAASGNMVFTHGEPTGEHHYTEEIVSEQYMKEEATLTSGELYYKSCVCGAVGTETFSYGEPLKVYTEVEKESYKPTSLTVTLYDSKNSVYGFAWNTLKMPLRPVIQIGKDGLTGDYEEYLANVEVATSLNANDKEFTYYTVKVAVDLDPSETYTYRAYDKYVDVGTDMATLQTKDTKATAFTFVHMSDSQETADSTGEGTGRYFEQVLSQIVGSSDFIVHTGDVVQDAKYKGHWDGMLDSNFAYLSKIPLMAISGNHETDSGHGYWHSTYNHFNFNLPEQKSTQTGLYYSFVYGNAKFIMLNTNELTARNGLKNEQYNWLVSELENNTATWTIVGMHNPMYSVGKWGMDTSRNQASLGLRAQLQSLFAEYGVDVVLQGHDHIVSKTFPINGRGEPQSEKRETVDGVEYSVDPSGVIYVMNGPVGDQRRDTYGSDNSVYEYGQIANTRSWAEFAIDGEYMKVTVKYYDGTQAKTYYTWGVKKTAA